MIGRIVEVAENQRHLFVSRGFMVVKDTEGEGKELARIPLDDIGALIANAHGLSYTNNLLVALAERGTPLVLCAANHIAVGMLLPIDSHFELARRIDAQIEAGQPLRKRLWACLVKAKLTQQGAVLRLMGQPDVPLTALVAKVRSGDPSNIEAQGAKRYWSLLMGPGFRRDRNQDGVNALLNYGYTVLRAATARAVLAAGLHPAIGLHHSNDANAMRLVDDLMEPFRPMIDLEVVALQAQGELAVSPKTKRALALVLFKDMQTEAGRTPVTVCLQKLASSLAQVLLKQRDALELPQPYRPLPAVAPNDD